MILCVVRLMTAWLEGPGEPQGHRPGQKSLVGASTADKILGQDGDPPLSPPLPRAHTSGGHMDAA